ncbi:MAG: BPTD_3080 family restriction endonuclease [Patescibacteria group bacterium]
MAGIEQLIINSPYEEPTKHWRYNRETRTFSRIEERRPAGYVVATPGSKSFDDPGIFVPLPLVNKIRPRVKAWREDPDTPYAGVTGITKTLLEHWRDPEQREHRFFFCQLEAIETLIWLTEAPVAQRAGIDSEIEGDGGPFLRLCAKMATGTGKTILMAMVCAWQILNKVTYPQDKRFSKNVLVVAPGLTVKSRLQVLLPAGPGNYYEEFGIVPPTLLEKLRQGRVLVRNWQALNWETDEQIARKKSVDKRGAKSDEAYVRDVLGEMAEARNIVVINDEAHHAWRVPAESKIKGLKREEIEEATKWVGGLDRIHRARGILTCYDFSATPFAPSGKQSTEEALFNWIVSDFGLNDAIEAGLVKTPRVVIRDDGKLGKDYRSRFYHIYKDPEVNANLNRKAQPHEVLPPLVTNGYYFLGLDWLEALKSWRQQGHRTPPVMITVANRTETAARIKYAFDHGQIRIDELCVPELTLHIDSKALELAESQIEAPEIDENTDNTGDDAENGEETAPKRSKKEQAELLRRMVDTIGQVGKPGERIQNVISVGMLSEGWDAKTVTHIMGLRAFSSQLLCEQVVGRGLRRTSYEVDPATGRFEPEYVNIFGVPFTFLPHEGGDGPPPPPPSPKTKVEPMPERLEFEITWPNIIRIDHVFTPRLQLDLGKVRTLTLDAADTATLAELAPVVEGKPDVTKISEIKLVELGRKYRRQRIIFEAARDVYDQMRPTWPGNREYLLAQLVVLVEKFLASDRLAIMPSLFETNDLRRRILIILNMGKIVQHLMNEIIPQNVTALVPVFDTEHPIRSTGEMRPWYTGKPCEITRRSHINVCVFDSTWEASEAFILDHDPNVKAWVKNDHLGFEIFYVYQGVVHRYRPDFLIRLANGTMLVLEVKGEDSQQNQVKRDALAEWVEAVNNHGGFGRWAWAVSRHPADVNEILARFVGV